MLEMLCQILQTDSVPAVQQWLVSAGDRGKCLYKAYLTKKIELIIFYIFMISVKFN